MRSCKCGDDVSALGFVRAMRVDSGTAGKGASGLMLMYLEAVSVTNHTAPRGEDLSQARAAAEPPGHSPISCPYMGDAQHQHKDISHERSVHGCLTDAEVVVACYERYLACRVRDKALWMVARRCRQT